MTKDHPCTHPMLDDDAIGDRYFFPQRDRVENPFVVDVDGARLVCGFHHRERASALVAFHGNGEVVSDTVDMLRTIADRSDRALLVVEYRGYGESTGRPALGAMLHDARAVFDAADLDPARTVVFGRSVGSIYAIELAAARQTSGLILESGIHDVKERILLRARPEELGVDDATFDAAMNASLDHHAKLTAFAGKTLVLHAVDDDLVDVSHAHRNHETAAHGDDDDASLVVFPHGGHNGIYAYNRAAYDDAVVTFLRRMNVD